MTYKRFKNLIFRSKRCFNVFGIIRANILRQTKLIGNFIASDRILLAELILRGRFFEIPEYLFNNSEHMQKPNRAYTVRYELVGWYDETKKGKLVFPKWRLFLEYLKAN